MGLALRRLVSQTKAPDDSPSGPSFGVAGNGRPAFPIGASVSHFRLLEWLGRGERGFEVYLAHDLAEGRRVALKLLVSDRPLRGEESRLLRREAEAVSALRHPNLCPVYEVGETRDGILFIAMACCEGRSLAERIARGPLEIADAVDLAAQIAEGLARVHEAGIVHRTLKPSDVLVSHEGRVWIADFGLGRLDERTLVAGESGEAPSRYLSPEQVRGAEPDARSDVWGLGAILYEMVTGRPPFPQGPVAGAADPAPMSRLREGVPPDLQAIVARALAFRPSERYANAREMREELRGGAQPAALPAELRGDFGPYRIGELIGGGGMGVVYRAQDRRLGRSVAIKLLPPELTRDPVSKARFLQEARAASALDHPNLCTVYEVGEAGASQLYLAMPCYDGETLRNRIDTAGALPVPEALDIAVQVLKGLAKAHRHGIVHRDVKPANLMVTDDGVVKILDFGIAKLAGVAADLTRAGTRVGTPAYMSPEQARGEEVDARTDLWSVGVVLYEMLAGARPASGVEPAPIRRLRPEVPSEVESILRRLLAPRKQDRYETAAAVLADLRVLLGTISGTGTATRDVLPVRRRSPRLWTAAALALGIVGAGAAAGVGYWLRWDGVDRSSPLFATYSRITDQEGRELFPSLSPDGNFFAYVKASGGSSDIHLQRIGGRTSINLTPDTPWEDTQPAFSPDGEQIAFRSDRDGGGLFVMGATGESVRRLTDFGFNPSWSPDGKRIVFATEGISRPAARSSVSQLWILDIATSALRRVVEEDAVQPSWSPDGSRIAYWGLPAGGGKRTISTVSASGGEPVRAAAGGWNPVWSADGHLYFASDRGGSMNLWRLRIDEASGRVRGEPRPVTTPSPWSAMPSPSRDGRRVLYVSAAGEKSDVWMLTRDP